MTSSLIMSGPQFIRPQSTGLLGLGEMLESLQAATEAKNSSQVYRCTLADLVSFAVDKPRNSSGDKIANVNLLCDDIVHALKIQ